MAYINFDGLRSNLLSGDTAVTTGSRVMFAIHGNSIKEIFESAKQYAARNGLHNISCHGTENLRANWEKIFGETDPEHHFLDDQETDHADDQEGRKNQTLDAEVLRQQGKG